MKSFRLHIAVLMTISFMIGCSNHHHAKDASDSEEWAAMDAFHKTMADAFHPFKDSGDLTPAKNLADDLADRAETLAGGTRPEKVNTEEITALLMKLKTSCRSFADHVKAGASDPDLGTELTGLHEQFHHLMEFWDDNERRDHE